MKMPNSKIEELEQEIQDIKDILCNSGIGKENKSLLREQLNNLDKTGFFYINDCRAGDKILENGYLISLIYVNSYKTQIFTAASANSILQIRKCVNGTWTEFIQI